MKIVYIYDFERRNETYKWNSTWVCSFSPSMTIQFVLQMLNLVILLCSFHLEVAGDWTQGLAYAVYTCAVSDPLPRP